MLSISFYHAYLDWFAVVGDSEASLVQEPSNVIKFSSRLDLEVVVGRIETSKELERFLVWLSKGLNLVAWEWNVKLLWQDHP